VTESSTGSASGKGRPTPKRSDAQKRRGGPVAPPPANRKEAAKQLRAKQAEDRTKVRQGNKSGDDRAMLPRDQGPIRRQVRDIIDAHRSPAFMLLPVAAFLVVAQIVNATALTAVAVFLWLVTLLSVALDLSYTGLRLRKTLRAAYPNEPLRGHIGYGLLRTTVFRRMRMPRPQTKPGPLRFGRPT
jgi:hypothetical protein